MPNQPLTVSVIIPLYNREALVVETLASVQAQTYPHWEAVVVDDGSTDQSYEAVEQWAAQDERIRLLHRSRNPKGAPTCRNIGVEQAIGDYLIFLDSDDRLAPFCLEQRTRCVALYPEADFLVFSTVSFEKNQGDTNRLWNVATTEDDLTRFLRGDSVWQTSGPIHKKSSFLALGGFDESLSYWQDYELHIRMLSQRPSYQKCMHLPPDNLYRQHDGPTLSQGIEHSLARLDSMSYTYQKIAELLIQRQVLNSERRRAVRSRLFWLSLNQVSVAKNIAKGLTIWQYGYQAEIENAFRFIVGYTCLSLKYFSVYLPQGTCWFSLLYKLTVRLLPRQYRLAKTSLLCIRYQGLKIAEDA